MNVTKNDADTALRDAGRAGEHSLTLFNYELTSPYLLLWGILWIVAGIIGVISPANSGIGWLIVDTIGIVATGYLVASDARRFDKDNVRNEGLRYGATVIVLTAFITMTFVVFAPVSGVEVQTFITILIAAIYMILGLWTGYRLADSFSRTCCIHAGPVPADGFHFSAVLVVKRSFLLHAGAQFTAGKSRLCEDR